MYRLVRDAFIWKTSKLIVSQFMTSGRYVIMHHYLECSAFLICSFIRPAERIVRYPCSGHSLAPSKTVVAE
jgi:hypothetical protein